VILEADHDLNNLIGQYYQPRLIAHEGQSGMGKGMDGHAGKDLVVKVPCGTLVWRIDSGGEPSDEPEKHQPVSKGLAPSSAHRPLLRSSAAGRAFEIDLESDLAGEHDGTSLRAHSKGEWVADLTEHGQRFVLCKGGRGGLGNRNFATSTRQTPRFAQPGEPGEEGNYLFELRIIADVGLVGYPNAGKSTLLTAISHARPKIAPYPFTTLTPQIGIVEYKDFFRLTVCDVPGLIEGAHQNVGLGHEFLRHIERCKILVLLIDMAGTDNRAPWDDYKNLLTELQLYDPTLLEKPRLITANKMDEPTAEENLKKFKRRVKKAQVLTMAAAFDEGIEKFKTTIREAVEDAAKAGAK
jgi:GTP-binding protein